MGKIWLLNFITFISAFLLFQIELIIAKMFLPNYGGSYLVWGSCIVFFQAVLLLGYLYAHFAIRKFGIGLCRWFHLILLVIPLFFFPGKPLIVENTNTTLFLNIDVFLRLCMTIGPVFFVLATVSLFTQSYLSKSSLPSRNNPYPLYAVSNVGSFTALLSYPFVFEYFLTLSEQISIWRALYFLLIILHGAAFCFIGVKEDRAAQKELWDTKTLDIPRWLLLGAAGTIMFLSVNNIITIESAPVPLLWIMPLCIYLLSFVLNFKRTRWCPAWITEKIGLVLGFSMILYFLIQQRIFPFAIEAVLLNIALFALCMYCQNQLITTKPKDDRCLTLFYVVISLGSFLGGFFTSWIIPLIATGLIEYLFGLLIIAMTLPFGIRAANRGQRLRLVTYFFVFFLLWPIFFVKYNIWGLLIFIYFTKVAYTEFGKGRFALIFSLALILITSHVSEMLWAVNFSYYVKRNYYGIYRVSDGKLTRRLHNGTTLHGAQAHEEGRKPEPTTYYSLESPVGEIMTSEAFRFHRIGVVGLGVGTLATYTKHDQVIDFYELDRDVYEIASRFFTYTRKSASKINYIFGDARMSMEQNTGVKYDLLIIDAFGGDAIPTHLLTMEAIALYKNLLTDRGILLFHISNRFVDLKPILARNGLESGAHVCFKFNTKPSSLALPSHWTVLTWDDDQFKTLVSDFQWAGFNRESVEKVRAWTDDYSSMLPIINTKKLINPIKHFQPFYW